MVYDNANTVYIYYTFPNPASASANTKSVTGSITSFNDANGDITLQLIEQGLTEPVYETVVKGNTVNYSFASVAAGTYTLKVSKANHVTREYTVIVSDSSIIRDVKIHLKGDITGDGEITSKDKKLLYNHLNDPSKVLEGYEYDVADVSGEGDITSKDKKLLYNHINDPSKRLW